MKHEVIHGDCVEVMRSMADDSVDSVVTDPPYGLGFMGKKWDALPPGREVFEECLRVLKPGGHLLAFGGSRTYHRLAVAVEDAGFEIRDQIMWLYGSGFPKSLDVSKAIDKMDASEEQERRRRRFTAWVRSTSVTSRQINEATGTNMGGHYTTAASQPAIMTREHLEACRHLFREVPQWIEQEADKRSSESRNMAEREVVGNGRSGKTAIWQENGGMGKYDITAPATPPAQQWQGWGTALKPAHEPIVMARKPLAGTVAENVLAHGTGALNIDGCRVGTDGGTERDGKGNAPNELGWENMKGHGIRKVNAGRWPANLIHDGSNEATQNMGDAARYFYCAKASKRDRNEGLEEMPLLTGGQATNRADGSAGVNKPRAGAGRTGGNRNTHPTVKPTDLMRYLVRLVTPPGGTVLDPFTGSGSTGKAAALEGFAFIGIEKEEEYVELARARIEHVR